MFKKAVEVKASQRLSGADRKKLRRHIGDRFKQASDADVDVIFPPKADVSVTKLANRVLVYSVDGGPPMVFDVDGEIFPTVYALWKLPTLIPAFVLKGAEVSRYVVGGADLMFPGVSVPSEGFPAFKAGEPWAVKVPGNAFPIAVGSTVMSGAEAEKAGFRGRAVRIMHYYPDTLWSSAEGRYVPNAGFTKDMVFEDPANQQSPAAVENAPLEVSTSDNSNRLEETANDAEKKAEAVEADIRELKLTEPTEVENEMESGTSAGVTDSGTSAATTTEEMDLLLDKCLLQALHTTVKDKDLPIPGSTLWSGHILPCRPSGSALDVKKSSHKKLSKWLQAKANSNLIVAKEDKHRKEIMLYSVNRRHPLYQEFKPEKKQTPEASTASTAVKHGNEESSVFEAVEVWKCSSHVAPVFRAIGADASRYYSAPEAAEVVFGYVEKENLVKPDNQAVVILDAVLCDALFKGAVKKGASYPTEIHKKDLGATFLGRMQAHHKVIRGEQSLVKKGALKSIQMVTERRQGNKKVTRLSGVESFLIDADTLATELQKKFACSTSTAELPGKKGEFEVLVQGGVLEDLGKHLVQHYGIPKKYIEILDKTKK